MDRLSSIPLETRAGEKIILSASGFHLDPLRVLLMSESDYVLAMNSIASGNEIAFNSRAMPILSSDRPSITLTLPSPGRWRIVYQTADADSVTVEVIPSNG